MSFFFVFLSLLCVITIVLMVRAIIMDIKQDGKVKSLFLTVVLFVVIINMIFMVLFLIPFERESNITYLPLESQRISDKYVEIKWDDETKLLEIPEKRRSDTLYMEVKIVSGLLGNIDCMYSFGVRGKEFESFRWIDR